MNYERFISMLPSAHDESSYRNLLKIAKILNRELLIEDKKAFSAIFRLIDLICLTGENRQRKTRKTAACHCHGKDAAENFLNS